MQHAERSSLEYPRPQTRPQYRDASTRASRVRMRMMCHLNSFPYIVSVGGWELPQQQSDCTSVSLESTKVDTTIYNNLAVFPEAPLTFRAVNFSYSTRNVHNLLFCNLHGHTLQ